MPVGSHKDAFLAHQKVKKTFSNVANNELPKLAAQILLDFVKSQRQIISENVPDKIEITDIEKYDKEKVKEALHAVENLCGKCNESHDNNCFVNQARRVLIAMLTGVDVKEKFNGTQSLDELLKIAEELKNQTTTSTNINNNQNVSETKHNISNSDMTYKYDEIEREIDKLKNLVSNLRKDYMELKEKDIFRATLIDEVVETIKQAANGDFKNPMPVHEDEQLGKIANAYNMMLETINRMFKNLDNEVAKRSSELKMLMANIKIGIFSINRDFKINREYSKECLKIFDCEEIGGMNFFDLIQVYDKHAEKKDEIKKFIMLYFNNLALDDDAMNMLNPLIEHKLNNKYLQFTFYPIKSLENDTVENILVQCVDLTQNKLLQMELDEKDKEARRVHKIVLNREAFEDFISETTKMINTSKQIALKDKLNLEDIKELYRIAHTIKGGAGCFDLTNLVSYVTEFENELANLLKNTNPNSIVDNNITNNVIKTSELFNEVIKYSEKILGKVTTTPDDFELRFKKSRLDELIGSIKNAINIKTPVLEKTLNSFYEIPASRIFAKSFAMVPQLANKLSKEVKLNVTGSDITIPFDKSTKLSETMLHLIRNAIDHGIELPTERENLGKPIEGNINVNIKKENDKLEIIISDDGRGLDPNKIAEIALQKGIITNDELLKMSDNEKIQLIFKPGFSTKNEVSEISGRGVGMDVVKNAIENILGGKLYFESYVGKGTTFKIELKI